jgi:diadenosine tetraphosphate (Ap4A) HIT family hydrolase
VSEYTPFDLDSYVHRIQNGPCFICATARGEDTSNYAISQDDTAVVFLNKYPTLYGYTLVAPTLHREQVTGDFSSEEYLALQRVVYRVDEALRQELSPERVYILSLGSRQGNSHVHWHIAPLPPGVPFEEQQLEALTVTRRGYLNIADAEMRDLAQRIAARLAALD